jgi:two-component system response regulator HydG
MPASRIALAADNPRLIQAIEQHLNPRVGPIFTCSLEKVHEFLGPETDGLLLLAVDNVSEVPSVYHIVQGICLQKLPPVIVIVDAVQPPNAEMDALEPYCTRRIRWPEQADALLALARERSGRGIDFSEMGGGSLEELLSQRLLAQTPSLLPLVERVALAATHDVTVLLNGETGTGKTFIARLIHEHSPRREHRFLTVPCGAMSDNLVESEFFGHAKGAFTGADRPKVGKFAAVGQGTLLLDEIDTLGLEQQASLLRVIETGEFEPVGSIETQKCCGRLIVASNVNLEDAVAQGRFRADLYFRLNVMSFHLPPLRERVQDIGSLARGMATRFCQKYGKRIFDIHPDAMAALENFAWPGNLRQLENAVQHAVLVCNQRELQMAHLPPAIQESAAMINSAAISPSVESLHQQRDQTERAVIHRALVNHGYSRSRAALALGISRVTLYKKMKKYGLMNIPLQPA